VAQPGADQPGFRPKLDDLEEAAAAMQKRAGWGDVGEPWSAAPQQTVIELVHEACRKYQHAPAMIFEDGLVVTYAQLLEASESFAGYLAGRIEPGDTVAVILRNRAEFMIAWLAVVANRAILVSVNPDDKIFDARHILRDSGAMIAIMAEEHVPLIEALRPELVSLREVITVRGDEPNGLAGYAGPRPLRFTDAGCARADICNIYYTSGTTGMPKGCMVDHEWWLRTVDVLLRRVPQTSSDRVLCCLQFFYSDPGHLLLECLATGGAIVVMRRFSVSRFWDVVRDHEVSLILSFSSIPLFLLKAEPHPRDRDNKVRVARHLAMPPDLHRQVVERWGFPWIEGYGITEGNVVTSMPLDYADEMTGSGSIGIPVPEVDVRLVDDDGVPVPTGTTGEFLVRGPGIFRGYLNRPEATQEVLADRWLHTGDLGREDERGFLYFMGRKKDVIRRSGQNLTAAEVEDALRAHPLIIDAAVMPVPDRERGEEVKAYVLLAAGKTETDLPGEKIVEFCADRLAWYKVPRYVEYRLTDFPRTPSMRIRKEVLKAERSDLTEGCWDRDQGERSRGRA
jgi:crotonobetaine/carnitine-CoA ligase